MSRRKNWTPPESEPLDEATAKRIEQLRDAEGWIESAVSATECGIGRWKDDVSEAIRVLQEAEDDAMDAKHVVMGGTGARCRNCGTEQAITYPCSITIMAAVGRAFTEDHARCKLTDAGRARMEFTDAWEWLRSWDTGASALTIMRTLTKTPLEGSPGIPHDPADFGRCYRLLAVETRWRERLGEVAHKYPDWRPFVDRWDDLTKLYEEESTAWSAPKLFELIQELRP